MENSGAIQASLSGRYASALFDLARESKVIEEVETSLAALEYAMDQSDDLRRLVTSPLIARGAAASAIMAVGGSLNLDKLTTNFLGVLASNRRLAQLTKVVASFRDLAANHRGKASATVTTAHGLSDDQLVALKAKLKARVGREVAVTMKTDPDRKSVV